MAKDKEISDLAQKLISMPLAEQLQRDMDKWAATLLTDGANGNKRDAAKRLMLLIGSGNLKILGNKLEEGEVKQGEVLASANNLPIAFYLSGHGGRVYMSLDNTPSQSVLNWITNEGIHKGRYFLPDNREGSLKGNEIVYDRHAGTHSANVDKDGNIQELKGKRYGVYSILGRMLNYITFGFFFSQYSQHLGMNIPFGGEGQKYKDITGDIKGEGSSGHLYINAGNNFLGVGMEGTAPGSEGPLGSHSKTGGADRFAPGEGQKSFVRFDFNDPNFMEYVKAVVAYDINNYKGKFTQIKDDYQKYGIKTAEDIKKATKEEQVLILKYLGLHVLMDEKGKPEMISTTLGAAMMNEGMVVPYNYNGQKIKFSDQALTDIMSYNGVLPDEIIYFKPQDSVEKFMAQALIFADIDNKPLIKNNPQLSLKECFALSLLYDWQGQVREIVGDKWDDVKKSDIFVGIMAKIDDGQQIDYNSKLIEVSGVGGDLEQPIIEKKAEETQVKLDLEEMNKAALKNRNEKSLPILGDIANLLPKELLVLSLIFDAQARSGVTILKDNIDVGIIKKRGVYSKVLQYVNDLEYEKPTNPSYVDLVDKVSKDALFK